MVQSKLLSEPKFIGREQELAKLEHHLNQAIEGKGTTVFVSGEAGVGKTRLVTALLKKANLRGVSMLSGWCLSEAGVPYFPFIEAFNTYFASFDEEEQPSSSQQPEANSAPRRVPQIEGEKREITAWLTRPRLIEKPDKHQILSPQVWKDQAFAAVTKTLHSISSRKPIIFFLEDLQWADSASLALLQYIARAVNNSERILVLGTYRSEELTANIEGHPHPLADVLRLMRREDLFAEIKLSKLDNDDVARIAENMIGGNLQPKIVEKLTARSNGNPLFVIESMRMLYEQRGLVQENNQWRLSIDELSLPTKIKDIVLRRLSVLEFAKRRVLDAASVIGEKFDVNLLSNVLELDILNVLETLNVVAQITSLVSVEENCYSFNHAMSREVIYEELSAPLKRGYHAKIAEKLEKAEDGAMSFSDLAYHYSQAGNIERATKYALEAGKDELARFSNVQAIKHFQYVLERTQERDVKERRIALEGIGDAYAANSMYAEAITTFDKLADSNTGEIRLRAIRKATDAAFRKGDKPDILVEYAKKAEDLAQYNRLEMARIINNRGRAFSWAGRGDMKMDLADYNTALQIFEEENSLTDVADALWRSGIISDACGDSSQSALGKMLRSRAIFKELGDVQKEVEAASQTGLKFFGLGLFPEAKSVLIATLGIGEKLGLFSQLILASRFIGELYEHEGMLMYALSQALKAQEYAKKTDTITFSDSATITRLHTKLGDLKHAEDSFRIMTKERKEGARGFFEITELIYKTARGEFADLEPTLEKNLEFFKRIPASGLEITFRENCAWVLEKQGKIKEAKIQQEKIQKLLEHTNKRFEHSDVQLSAMAPRKIHVEEEFELRLDLVNVGRSAAILDKIEHVIPSGLKVVDHMPFYSLQNSNVVFKEKSVDPFQVETVKLKLKATHPGSYSFNPEVTYVNELGQTNKNKAKAFTIFASTKKPTFEVLPGRITTGCTELDRLLMGGIPENYAVVLTGPPSDERELIIKSFLEAGTGESRTSFYVATEAMGIEYLLEKPGFNLFLCNQKPKLEVADLPNVSKLRSKTDLTNLNIALLKAYRDAKASLAKRICIDIISDVLLEYGVNATRKWLAELITDLVSKGFTVLAVVNPLMHTSEELNSILDLFDGELNLSQTEDPLQCRKSISVKKLRNQDFIKNPICIIPT